MSLQMVSVGLGCTEAGAATLTVEFLTPAIDHDKDWWPAMLVEGQNPRGSSLSAI